MGFQLYRIGICSKVKLICMCTWSISVCECCVVNKRACKHALFFLESCPPFIIEVHSSRNTVVSLEWHAYVMLRIGYSKIEPTMWWSSMRYRQRILSYSA